MKDQDNWILFKDIDWNDENYNQFNVDTRDFHVGYCKRDLNAIVDEHDLTWHEKSYKTIRWDKIRKYPRFFFSEEELKALIERLYTESGGKGEWRMLDLVSGDERVRNWNLKYLRIWRTDKGFVICNNYNVAIPKPILEVKVDLEHLAHH